MCGFRCVVERSENKEFLCFTDYVYPFPLWSCVFDVFSSRRLKLSNRPARGISMNTENNETRSRCVFMYCTFFVCVCVVLFQVDSATVEFGNCCTVPWFYRDTWILVKYREKCGPNFHSDKKMKYRVITGFCNSRPSALYCRVMLPGTPCIFTVFPSVQLIRVRETQP